jgi:hypothetical protein
MSGLGRKVWTVLEQLGAADVNGYLMDQSVMVFADSTARTAEIPAPTAGMVTYRVDGNVLEFYDGTNWVDLVASSDLGEMADVNLTGLQNLDSLVWDGTQWVNQRLDLADAGDVNITTPGAGDFLAYDDLNSEWVNSDISLDDLSDVTAPAPFDKASLVYDDALSQWVPVQVAVSDLQDTFVVAPADGETLVYNTTGGIWENDGTTYQKTSEKDQINGYAGLDSSGKLDPTQIPSLAIGDTFVVANQAARLALTTAETGDIAVQTDTSETYILQGTDPSDNDDWVKLLFPPDAVDSVNGQTGAVVLELGDIDDVTIATPADGEILTYDSATGEWYNGAAPAGTLAGLSDVDLTGLADGQTIVYDATAMEWIPGDAGGKFAVSDTAPSSPTNGDTWFNSATGVAYIYYVDVDGGQWVQLGGGGGGGGGGGSLILDDLTDVAITSPSGNEILLYDSLSGNWINTTIASAGIALALNQTLTNPTFTNYTETLFSTTGTSLSVDLSNGTLQKLTTTGSATITLPSPVAGKSFTIIVVYGGTHSITWAGGGTLKWSEGVAPTLSSSIDIFSFVQDGTNTYGGAAGLAYS